jgi:hypothetical protein
MIMSTVGQCVIIRPPDRLPSLRCSIEPSGNELKHECRNKHHVVVSPDVNEVMLPQFNEWGGAEVLLEELLRHLEGRWALEEMFDVCDLSFRLRDANT